LGLLWPKQAASSDISIAERDLEREREKEKDSLGTGGRKTSW
jgi:hypothetical protein